MLEPRILWVLFIVSLLSFAVLQADSFTERFEQLWDVASPDQRYRLLYDLPKGGDLHNHSPGSNRPEWMMAIAKNPERCGGDVFWTRMRFASPLDAIAPPAFCHTIRNFSYQALPADIRAEYVRLDQLTPEQEQEWADAFRLESEGEGRSEFFDVIWTRLGDTLTNP